jgi:hypothetical protein
MDSFDISESLKIFQDSMAKLSSQLQPLFENIAKSMIEFKKNSAGYYELSNYGWYLDMDLGISETNSLLELMQKNEIQAIDEYLSKYYSKKLRRIEEKLCSNHKNRKAIISEAFECHRKKRYFSSITLFLTQADGICHDKSRKFYFKNNKKLSNKNVYKPEIEAEIERVPEGILDYILAPLTKPTAINDLTSNVKNFPVRLNRHEILHGVDFEFSSKLNSLKVYNTPQNSDHWLS